jgi:ABC-type ATPase with predicted acetyltransferase domain
MKLERQGTPLHVEVRSDEFVEAAEKAFDCASNGKVEFYPWRKPNIPTEYGIGVIVGSSGSGKSTLLNSFGWEKTPRWQGGKPIISHFRTPDDAINALTAVGLNTVPSWYKPYSVLSNGEKFRADLAMKLDLGREWGYVTVDEYTSVVDRNVAKAASVALSRYVKRYDIKRVVLATCHRDVLEWLEPDWVIDTDVGEFTDGFFLPDQKSKSMYTQLTSPSGKCLKTIII